MQSVSRSTSPVDHRASFPKLHSTLFTSPKKEAPTVWPVADLFSTNVHKQTKLLNTIIDQRNHIIHNLENEAWIEAYLKNEKLLYAKIQSYSTESIKSQFKSYVPKDERALFIHIICDVAHQHPQAKYVCLAADYLLEKKIDRLSTHSFAKQKDFLSPTKSEFPIQTIYKKTETTLHPVMAPGAFGNILFRFTATEDLVFSPVFMDYLKDTLPARVAAIDPQEKKWASLQNDEMFFKMGFKKLTDRDAVAHYLWLTEKATKEEFAAYLYRVGTTPAPEIDSPANRKATLQIASSQYWRGHYAAKQRTSHTASKVMASAVPEQCVYTDSDKGSHHSSDIFVASPPRTSLLPDNSKQLGHPNPRQLAEYYTHRYSEASDNSDSIPLSSSYSENSDTDTGNSATYRYPHHTKTRHLTNHDTQTSPMREQQYPTRTRYRTYQDTQTSPMREQQYPTRNYHAIQNTYGSWQVQTAGPVYEKAQRMPRDREYAPYVPTARYQSWPEYPQYTIPVATPVVESKPTIIYITPIPAKKTIFFNDRIHKTPKTTLYKVGSWMKKTISALRGQ